MQAGEQKTYTNINSFLFLVRYKKTKKTKRLFNLNSIYIIGRNQSDQMTVLVIKKNSSKYIISFNASMIGKVVSYFHQLTKHKYLA